MDYPLTIKKPKMIFVNSMSDLFHERISFEFVAEVFEVIKKLIGISTRS
jgi:protein gp37